MHTGQSFDALWTAYADAYLFRSNRRIDDCFAAIDYFEDRRVPFVVAINNFPGSTAFSDAAVRDALALRPDQPLLRTDARDPAAALGTLISLVEHALARVTAA